MVCKRARVKFLAAEAAPPAIGPGNPKRNIFKTQDQLKGYSEKRSGGWVECVRRRVDGNCVLSTGEGIGKCPGKYLSDGKSSV